MIDPAGLIASLLFALALGLGAAECQPPVDKPATQPPPARLETDTFAVNHP